MIVIISLKEKLSLGTHTVTMYVCKLSKTITEQMKYTQ